jgi:hypothetical protein
VQRTEQERLPGERRFLVDQDLWDQLDEQNKAALVTHELVYWEKLDYNENASSRTVRYFNGFLLSPAILNVDQRQLAWDSKFGYYEEYGERIPTYGPGDITYSRQRVVRSDYLPLPASMIMPPLCHVVSARANDYRWNQAPITAMMDGCGDFEYTANVRILGGSRAITVVTANQPSRSSSWNDVEHYDNAMVFVNRQLQQGILKYPLRFSPGRGCPEGAVLRRVAESERGVFRWDCLVKDQVIASFPE